MKAAAHPEQERRLEVLRGYEILDTPRESDFDDIVALASRICEMPISTITLIDVDRQWFKAEVGFDVDQTPLEDSVCAHAILGHDFLEIPDLRLDPRMSDNPKAWAEGGLRFYAGALLRTAEGIPLGTLCVLDTRPRALTDLQRQTIRTLARQVMTQLDLRLALKQQQILRQEIDHRVKNSLAMIASLLRMQKAKAPTPETARELGDVEQRLSTVAALHEEIYRAGSGDRVPLEPLLANVSALLRRSAPAGVEIATEVGAVDLTSKQASSVAMLANEFVANALKYAFPDGRSGRIDLTGRREGDTYRLAFRDNGIGLPDADHTEPVTGSSGLGMRIIDASASQLGGRAVFDGDDRGTRLEVAFPLDG